MSEPSTAIARREMMRPATIPSDDEMRRNWRLAEGLAKSGKFPDARSAAEAYAKILVGYDLGLSATQALIGIHIVEGKPQVGATLLAGFIKRTPGYDYFIHEHDDEHCTISFSIDDTVVGESEFTIEQAKTAELGGWPNKEKWAKSGWGKYPRNMLFARAISNGIRWFMPDATGGVPVYAEGEIEGRPALTVGSGDGTAQGLDLGPAVEKVIARADALGHEGFERATVEIALGARDPEYVAEWVENAKKVLDEYEAAHPIDEAEVVAPSGGESDGA